MPPNSHKMEFFPISNHFLGVLKIIDESQFYKDRPLSQKDIGLIVNYPAVGEQATQLYHYFTSQRLYGIQLFMIQKFL